MTEDNGIVNLQDLPSKEFYVELESNFIKFIKAQIVKKWKIKEFSNMLNVSDRILEHWLKKESLLRLDVFEKIIKFFGIKESNVRILGFRGKNGKVIKYPKFPFDFNTKNGVRIIAAILGDGSLSKSPSYTNKNMNLIYGFIEDCQAIFGNLELCDRPKEKGYFSSEDLVERIPRSKGHIRNMILKFSNNHEIIKIQPVISDGKKFYSAHYKVN